MPRDELWSTDKNVVLALIDGRMPDGVDPDSTLGRHYQWRMNSIAEERQRRALLPEMSQARAERIIAILRGGGPPYAA